MLELLETPTFVVDDLFDSKNVRVFDYLEFEDIPFEVLELCSAELPYRTNPYYVVIVDDLKEDYDLFQKVNPRALEMAQQGTMLLVFFYEGPKNLVFSLDNTLVTQLIEHGLALSDIRIVSEIRPILNVPSYVYFSYAEMEAYLDAHDTDYVDGFCTNDRERVFTCNVPTDTAHARLLCASMWYHALTDCSYINYPPQTNSAEILNSDIYRWEKHWSATDTLIDMFGQQLPLEDKATYELDYYNNAYWNFCMLPSFNSAEMGLSKNAFLPILNLQPFVIVGPAESLVLLERLGYKSFSQQVNESYDNIINDEERMQSLFRLVYEMAHFTGEELNELNEKLRSTIIHNQRHLLSSKRFKLITLLHSLKFGVL